MSVIGERLREARKKIDISQAKLAKKIGVNRAYLSYIENGKASPTFDFVEKLAVGLEMPFESLVLGHESANYEGLTELLKDRDYLLSLNPTREELAVLKSIRLDPRFRPSKKFFIEALLDYRKAKNSADHGHNS